MKNTTHSTLYGWSDLEHELNLWAEQGIKATFWWRDDDAIKASPELNRLLEQISISNAYLLLAVIPANVDNSIVDAVGKLDNVIIAQHGYAHKNHAPSGKGLGAWELGLHRGAKVVLDELNQGYDILSRLFSEQLIQVVVPPWNRIDGDLFSAMSNNGYKGVSTFGPEIDSKSIGYLTQANCHCDPIKWKGGARFTGENKAISMVIDHLVARRTNNEWINRHTGLLTHHLDMDDAAWAFTERLGQLITNHPAAQWIHPHQIFKISE